MHAKVVVVPAAALAAALWSVAPVPRLGRVGPLVASLLAIGLVP